MAPGAVRPAAAGLNADRAEPTAQVALLLLVDISDSARLWGWSRFVIGRFGMNRVEGLRFFKVLGSGHEGGFGLRPSGSHQGLFCLFADDEAADRFLAESSVCRAYRSHAREHLSVKLRAFSSRGSWSGCALPVSAETPASGPIAVLTRASIRPARVAAFWRHAPAAQSSLEQAPGCVLAMGLGEAPLLRQATFSVWDSSANVDAYARHGAHLEAARAARAEGYFLESMFVRFVFYGAQGTWKGHSLA